MPAGGSPQPMSVDPDGSTPDQVREAVLQRPHSALSAGSARSAPSNPLSRKNYASRTRMMEEITAVMKPYSVTPLKDLTEFVALKVTISDIQPLYQAFKSYTATLVETARTRDIILAPPQAAPPPPTTELAQVLSAVQTLSQKVTKLETAASKTPPPPKPAAKPPLAPTFLSAACAAADKPQPPPPPPKPAAKCRQPTKVVGLPEEGLRKWVITPAVQMKDSSTRPSPLAIIAKLNGKPSSNSVLTAYWTPAGKLHIVANAAVDYAAPGSLDLYDRLLWTIPGFEHGILHIAPWVKITKIKIPDVPVWNHTTGAPYSIQDITAALDLSTAFSDIRVTNKAAWAKAPATFCPTTLSAVSFSIEDPDGAVSNRLWHTALYLLGKKCCFEKWKPKPTSAKP
ncbi:hypothetical protein H0H81_011962 [Sphagnurus paluster]|uniref:Uncharacterized protein n=1 Tax=Sphagnurus paluster TaxID=117069 RepID=A0A9P7KFP0_9AGAR|nr:hypothetical protein H0H81_011962 [Sphagnurus paluster]